MKSRTAPGAKVFNKDKERLPGYVRDHSQTALSRWIPLRAFCSA